MRRGSTRRLQSQPISSSSTFKQFWSKHDKLLIIAAFVFGGIAFFAIPHIISLVDSHKTPTKSTSKWSKFVASSRSNSLDSQRGNNGGQWTWCTHLMQYGPNFDRGLANFISGILRPESALEFGCGIGLYINYIEHFTTAKHKQSSRFIGIEPESMIEAGVFGTSPFKATQLAMNIFETEKNILDSLGKFDVVLSSEVAEHIPLKYHDKMFDFMVAKTKKFLLFGAARPNQGGTGHLQESMRDMGYWIQKFKDRGMIHSDTLSKRLRDSAYNKWDKGANTFVMVDKDYYHQIDDINGLGGLEDVSDIFPQFFKKYKHIKENKVCKSFTK